MKSTDERLALLNARLNAMPRSARIRQPDNGFVLKVGQLWTPKPVQDDGAGQDGVPTWLLLLIEEADDGLFNAVPVFHWSELADDGDLLMSAGLAGVELAAALPLESTVDRSALYVCEGRFPESVVEHILSARAVSDDPIERNRFCWGVVSFGPQDHRHGYHNAIGAALEMLQAGVRATVFGEAASTPERHATPFDVKELFRNYALPAAADSGEPVTPCRVLSTPAGPVQIVRESDEPFLDARSRRFDPLLPGGTDPVCCEWVVPGGYARLPDHPVAWLYDVRSGRQVGKASVVKDGADLWITLTAHSLAPQDEPLRDPALLRILIGAESEA
jgi:hypothetical protein